MSQRNIFRRTLREIQGGTEEHATHEMKVSDSRNATEESLVAGYKSTLSPLDEGFRPPKNKPAKKPASNEARLDAVIAMENAAPWATLAARGKVRQEKFEAKVRWEMDKADAKK